MNSQYKQDFIDKIFKKFNQDSICYGILRNYKDLPQVSGDDIDIYLDNNNLLHFINDYLSTYILNLRWDYKIKYESKNFVSIVCYSVNDDVVETLQLDFFNDFKWRGISYLDLDFIKRNISIYNEYKIISPGSELAITYIKEILGYKHLREKHFKRFKEIYHDNSNDFIKTIRPVYRKKFSPLVSGVLSNYDGDYFKFASRVIKRNLVWNNFSKYVYFSLKSVSLLFSKLFRKKQLIVFVGPDGSGKSTLIDGYRTALDRFFPDTISIYHRRYLILPDLKTNRGLSSMKGKIKAGQNLKIKRSFVSIFVTLMVVIYYTLEFFLGNYILFKNRFNGRLVLYDRYYFDHFIQPTSRDLILPFKKLFLAFVARPTLIVHLNASSVEIYKRKQDLPEKEIEIQNSYLDKVLRDYDNVIQLDSVERNEKELVVDLFYKTIDNFVFYK